MCVWKPLILVLKGFCIGTADLIPGVSGGTMAWILKIYPDLIYAIRAFDLQWLTAVWQWNLPVILGRPNFSLLVPLGMGILCAVLFFTRIIPLPLLIQTHPEIIYGLFFGLVGGSIVTLLPTIGTFHAQHALMLLIGIMLGTAGLAIIPQQTPETTWFIFLCGIIAISAMLLPGISGSFILLMLQKYTYIFHAIGTLQFSIIIPFATGALLGLIAFSRLLSYLLQRYYALLLTLIIGLLTSSLWAIWPFQEDIVTSTHGKQSLLTTPYIPQELSVEVWMAMLMMLLGAGIIMLLQYFSRHSTSAGAHSTTKYTTPKVPK